MLLLIILLVLVFVLLFAASCRKQRYAGQTFASRAGGIAGPMNCDGGMSTCGNRCGSCS